jgi:hypothetical protein
MIHLLVLTSKLALLQPLSVVGIQSAIHLNEFKSDLTGGCSHPPM